MKLLIAQLVIFITAFIMTINNSCLSFTNHITGTIIFSYIVLIVIIFFIIITILDVIKKIKKEIVESIILSNDHYHNKNIEKIQWVFDYLCSTISGNENSIVDRVHNNNKILFTNNEIKLNNNLIETHTTHELLKELFMLENDTNTITKSNLTVSSEMLDAIMESMVEDNILHLDKTLEESFIDNKIIPKEKNSRTINRRKKQQL